LFNLYNRVLFVKFKFKFNVIKSKLLNEQQLDFYAKIRINQIRVFFNKNYIKAILLIDIKAFNRIFVNKKFVKLYKLFTILLRNFIKLRLVNNKFALYITHIAQVTINLSVD